MSWKEENKSKTTNLPVSSESSLAWDISWIWKENVAGVLEDTEDTTTSQYELAIIEDLVWEWWTHKDLKNAQPTAEDAAEKWIEVMSKKQQHQQELLEIIQNDTREEEERVDKIYNYSEKSERPDLIISVLNDMQRTEVELSQTHIDIIQEWILEIAEQQKSYKTNEEYMSVIEKTLHLNDNITPLQRNTILRNIAVLLIFAPQRVEKIIKAYFTWMELNWISLLSEKISNIPSIWDKQTERIKKIILEMEESFTGVVMRNNTDVLSPEMKDFSTMISTFSYDAEKWLIWKTLAPESEAFKIFLPFMTDIKEGLDSIYIPESDIHIYKYHYIFLVTEFCKKHWLKEKQNSPEYSARAPYFLWVAQKESWRSDLLNEMNIESISWLTNSFRIEIINYNSPDATQHMTLDMYEAEIERILEFVLTSCSPSSQEYFFDVFWFGEKYDTWNEEGYQRGSDYYFILERVVSVSLNKNLELPHIITSECKIEDRNTDELHENSRTKVHSLKSWHIWTLKYDESSGKISRAIPLIYPGDTWYHRLDTLWDHYWYIWEMKWRTDRSIKREILGPDWEIICPESLEIWGTIYEILWIEQDPNIPWAYNITYQEQTKKENNFGKTLSTISSVLWTDSNEKNKKVKYEARIVTNEVPYITWMIWKKWQELIPPRIWQTIERWSMTLSKNIITISNHGMKTIWLYSDTEWDWLISPDEWFESILPSTLNNRRLAKTYTLKQNDTNIDDSQEKSVPFDVIVLGDWNLLNTWSNWEKTFSMDNNRLSSAFVYKEWSIICWKSISWDYWYTIYSPEDDTRKTSKPFSKSDLNINWKDHSWFWGELFTDKDGSHVFLNSNWKEIDIPKEDKLMTGEQWKALLIHKDNSVDMFSPEWINQWTTSIQKIEQDQKNEWLQITLHSWEVIRVFGTVKQDNHIGIDQFDHQWHTTCYSFYNTMNHNTERYKYQSYIPIEAWNSEEKEKEIKDSITQKWLQWPLEKVYSYKDIVSFFPNYTCATVIWYLWDDISGFRNMQWHIWLYTEDWSIPIEKKYTTLDIVHLSWSKTPCLVLWNWSERFDCIPLHANTSWNRKFTMKHDRYSLESGKMSKLQYSITFKDDPQNNKDSFMKKVLDWYSNTIDA